MSKYQRTYPSKGTLLFDGGLSSKFERSLIEDNESPDCLNVIFENGSVGTRPGMTKLNTAAVGSFVGDGLYTRRVDTGAETMVAFWNGTAYALGTTTFVTIPSAQSVFTAGVRVGSTQQENHIFFGNGHVIPYKYNGTDWTRHGTYPPPTTSTIATAPTGTGLTGSYSYKFTFVNSQTVESDVGPVTNTMTAANENFRITSIPVAPQSFGVNQRRIYRTAAGGTTYKRVATINNNTTTTYDDGLVDGSLGADAPTDQGVPPKYHSIIYHAGRVFALSYEDPNYLFYSEIDNPYVFKATNFKKLGDATSDLAKGLAVYDNSILVFAEKSIFMEYMPSTNPAEWEEIRSKSPYGSKSPHALLEYDNKILFVAIQSDKLVGVGAFSGNTVEASSTLLTTSSAGSNLKSDKIEPDIFEMVESLVGNYSGVVFQNKAYLAVTYGSGQTTNNRVYVMDYSISRTNKNQREAWVPYTGWNASQFCVYGGNLYFQSSTATGFVYKHDQSVYSDDGAAINSYFWTKEYVGFADEENFHKDFRYADFLVDNAGAYYMGIGYRIDSDIGDASMTQVNLDPGGSIWGTMVWGRDMWGGGTLQRKYRLDMGTANGQRIQFKFSNRNTVNQRFKVHRGSFTYNLKGYR